MEGGGRTHLHQKSLPICQLLHVQIFNDDVSVALLYCDFFYVPTNVYKKRCKRDLKKTFYFSQGYAAEASKLSVSVAELGPTLVAREYTGLKIAGEDDI